MTDGELRAVDGLSYNIRKGESIGIVGESACGKSVSVLSVMRLIPYPPGIIMGGEAIFEGKNLLEIPEDDMRLIRGNRIGMIFQEPTTSLNPVLNVNSQLSEALQLHRGIDKGQAKQEAIRLLRLVGIPDAEKRISDYPYQFSGGMQQRIMIAMALSCNPSLLICDEPTTSVDVTVQAQLLEVIGNMKKEFDAAIIIITHNLGVVARYVEWVNVMYAGRLVESGPTEIIYGEPRHPYTMGLMLSVPRLDLPKRKDLHVIDGLPPNLARLPKGCYFSPRCEFKIEKCVQEYPDLMPVGDKHHSACWRNDEVWKLMKEKTGAA